MSRLVNRTIYLSVCQVYASKRRELVTALHVAIDLSLYGNIEVLLNHNADANIFDHNNETALHVAVRKADCVMTHMLLAKGKPSCSLCTF